MPRRAYINVASLTPGEKRGALLPATVYLPLSERVTIAIVSDAEEPVKVRLVYCVGHALCYRASDVDVDRVAVVEVDADEPATVVHAEVLEAPASARVGIVVTRGGA